MPVKPSAVARYRKRVPLTQGELGSDVGTTKQTIWSIESGRTAEPRPALIRAIAARLDVPVAEIYSEVPMGGGKGSGRKPGTPRKGANAADDKLMGRLRSAAARAKQDPPPPSVAANARKAFKNRKAS